MERMWHETAEEINHANLFDATHTSAQQQLPSNWNYQRFGWPNQNETADCAAALQHMRDTLVRAGVSVNVDNGQNCRHSRQP